MAREVDKGGDWTPSWVAVVAALVAVAAALALRAHVLPLTAWGLPVIGLLVGAIAAVGGVVSGQRHQLMAQCTCYLLLCTGAGAWAAWASWSGWTQPVCLAGVVGTLAGVAALHWVGGGPEDEPDTQPAVTGRKGSAAAQWQALIRQIVKQQIKVIDVKPWKNPRDGVRLHLELPWDTGMTEDELADFARRLAAAARLPRGCNIQILDAERQGFAYADIMQRDCLADEVTIAEGAGPASINDPFPVLTTPRGEQVEICLREQSMIVGGTVGSGKTTLLHRLIMRLARCVDALIWVVDLNGGGVAEPWVGPWARGTAPRPVVDWVADNEEEAAVMMAVAAAIARDRKTNREARLRRRSANTTVLPVDKNLPAIIVLTDEGGEVRQAVSLIGQVAGNGITRLAQIGRAEGVRAVMSILRGTSDLLDKGLRTNAALRLCLRMEEDDEYSHVLGSNPGKTKLLHKGSGYLRRSTDPRPIFGRTVNVLLDTMDEHAIATADLRPDLDQQAQHVAARVRVRDVLGGKDPAPEILALPTMRDVQAGRSYSGRWERFAAKLAEMRDEDPPEPDDPQPVEPDPVPTPDPAGAARPAESALSAWSTAVNGTSAPPPEPAAEPVRTPAAVDTSDQDAVDAEAQRLLAFLTGPGNGEPDPRRPVPASEQVRPQSGGARDRIVPIVDAAGPAGIQSNAIGEALKGQNSEITRGRMQDLLRELREEGRICYRDGEDAKNGIYVTPRNARWRGRP